MISQGDSMVSSDWKVFGIDMHCLLNCERGEKVASRVGFGSLECMSAGEGADQEEEKWSREFRGSAAPQLGAVMEKLEAECATSR